MSTTNDPEGEYKRKPMLDSDELYDEYLGDCPGNVGGTVIEKIINFYEGKINDGTLVVVKMATNRAIGSTTYLSCSCCGSSISGRVRSFKFCPGCGAKIIE